MHLAVAVLPATVALSRLAQLFAVLPIFLIQKVPRRVDRDTDIAGAGFQIF